MDDLISRQAVYDVLTDYYHHRLEIQHEALKEALGRVPTADLSEYCDKLWKTAYERGKAEKIIRCDECKHWDVEWIPAAGEGHYCPMMDHVMVGDEWCCYGERRTDG